MLWQGMEDISDREMVFKKDLTRAQSENARLKTLIESAEWCREAQKLYVHAEMTAVGLRQDIEEGKEPAVALPALYHVLFLLSLFTYLNSLISGHGPGTCNTRVRSIPIRYPVTPGSDLSQ